MMPGEELVIQIHLPFQTKALLLLGLEAEAGR